MRKVIFAIALAVALAAGLMSPANAAGTRASIISDGLRVDVTFTGKKPTKATLIVGGASYKLKRSGKTWTTKQLTAVQVAALIGQKARVKITVKGKKRTVRGTVGNGGAPTPPPTPPTPPTPPPPPAPLFAAPGRDLIGVDAFEAVKGYFYNSTLTDCPAGWPNCPVEERYGFFPDNTTWYCRLTYTSGADIPSRGTIQEIIGAEQKADGSWAVSFRDLASGYEHYYTVRVAANGSAAVQYWASGVDPATSPPSEVKTGLVWMRGAKNCSY